MKFHELVKKLQQENEGYIVLIRCGIFFSAIGKDAVIINDLLGIKTICAQENVCKCGIPANAIEKYIRELQKSTCSVVIYDYNKGKEDTYEKIAVIEGKRIEEQRKCLDCETCWYKEEKKSKTPQEAVSWLKANING